jgi:hypothetical protein
MRKLLKIVITLSTALVCAYLLLNYYIQKTFRLQLSFPGTTEESIRRKLDQTVAAVQHGVVPPKNANFKSVGSPREELRLLGLLEEFQVFEFQYGRIPRDASDFGLLVTNTALPVERREAISRYVRECKILTFPRDSYLLNCDGWSPQTAEETKALLKGFSNDVEKFYQVGGHVFLYAPPAVASRQDQTL